MPRKASITTAITAGVRGIPRRRSVAITGASAKLRSPASASGTKTSRPKYRAPMTTTKTARDCVPVRLCPGRMFGWSTVRWLARAGSSRLIVEIPDRVSGPGDQSLCRHRPSRCLGMLGDRQAAISAGGGSVRRSMLGPVRRRTLFKTRRCASISDGSRPSGVSRSTVSGMPAVRRFTISSRDRPSLLRKLVDRYRSRSPSRAPPAARSCVRSRRHPQVRLGCLARRPGSAQRARSSRCDKVPSRSSRSRTPGRSRPARPPGSSWSRPDCLKAFGSARLRRRRSSRAVCLGSDNRRRLPGRASASSDGMPFAILASLLCIDDPMTAWR